MILSLLTHEYFWLSFLPMVALSVGFWGLLLDRSDNVNEPLVLLILALGGGIISALLFSWIGPYLSSHLVVQAFGEELIKVILAIVVMELFRRRFQSVSQGIIYGFMVGLGFAFTEDLVYLMSVYETSGFDPAFWMVFQGRFWSSSLMHGVTTAFFGLFYSAAYLSPTVNKAAKESPLRTFFIPPSFYQLRQILTLHVTRCHLLFQHEKSVRGHYARTVILEGFLVAGIIHTLFNLALDHSFPAMAFIIALGGMGILRWESERIP